LEAARRVGVEPADTLFVGDGSDDELFGAKRAGLRPAQAAWFRGSEAGAPGFTAVPRASKPADVLKIVAAG